MASNTCATGWTGSARHGRWRPARCCSSPPMRCSSVAARPRQRPRSSGPATWCAWRMSRTSPGASGVWPPITPSCRSPAPGRGRPTRSSARRRRWAGCPTHARRLDRRPRERQDHVRQLLRRGRGAESLSALPQRINADPEGVERGLVQLVLTLVELLRQLMERQALRRVEAGGLTEEQLERLGETLMLLAARMEELKQQFGLQDDDLNLDLGPLGRLL